MPCLIQIIINDSGNISLIPDKNNVIRNFKLPDKDTVKIGRSSKCDIIFSKEYPRVSRSHAEIIRKKDDVGNYTYYIKDLNSTNGTYVKLPDKEPIKLTEGVVHGIPFGSVISFGTYIYHFVEESSKELKCQV